MLLDRVEYKIERTRLGEWRRFLYPNGMSFAEFTSHERFLGLPLIHYTSGICPETGSRKIAKGVLAVGRIAAGICAVGQASAGVVAVGQVSVGLVFALGQAAFGFFSVGQLALALSFCLGQFAAAHTAIGQFGFGKYVLAQMGMGEHVWTMAKRDPEAVEWFASLYRSIIPLRLE